MTVLVDVAGWGCLVGGMLVGVYRELILNNELPHPHDFLIITMVAVFALLIGYSVFHHHRDRFSDLI